jgi:uncharacterized membrane protein YccC
MLIWMGVLLARLKSRTSTPPSPTPSTTPTLISEEVVLKIVDSMAKVSAEQMKETRQMVVDLTQGRESQSQTGTPETWPTQSERPIAFDYDSTPLSAGIEAVLEREEMETEQARILREREELQERLIEKQAEVDRLRLEQSSQEGPWSNGSGPQHAKTD